MSADVRVVKHDELYVRVFAEKSIVFELNEHFSFYVDGYKWMPKYKSGLWDGKIKLFNTRDRLLPVGLLLDLMKFCKRYSYTLEIENKQDILPIDFSSDLDEFIADLPSITKTPPSDEYQFQLDALKKCVKLNKSLTLSPTGSGKSHIIYLLVRFLLRYTEDPILICVPTTSLVEQMVSDFASYANDGWDAESECHKIYSGRDKMTDKRVTVTTWQSIYKLPVGWFRRYGTFICDEAHLAKSDSITGIVGKMRHSKFRFGFTGTLSDCKTNEMCLRGLFGVVTRTTTSSKLMDSGVLSKLKINAALLKYPKEESKWVAKMKYQEEIDWLVAHPSRNAFIIASAFAQPQNTLVLFNYVEAHGEKLFERAQKAAARVGKEVFFVSGKTAVEERERIRAIVEKQNNVIVFASYGTFSTGINMKNLHTVIFAHPYKAKIKNLQSIGRVLRKSVGKDCATLIDIADDLSYNKRQNLTLRHFVERTKIYDAEDFEYTIKKHNI